MGRFKSNLKIIYLGGEEITIIIITIRLVIMKAIEVGVDYQIARQVALKDIRVFLSLRIGRRKNHF